MLQMQLIPGPMHWIVEVIHLAIGIVAMILGARLARLVRSARPRRRTPAADSSISVMYS
jgi:hypothetical protein